MFLGGYSTLNNDSVSFYIHHVTCKCKKKRFHCTFANYSFFELPGKPPHASVKIFSIFQFSISIRNFNLRNLKGNGNVPIDIWVHMGTVISYTTKLLQQRWKYTF